MSSTADTLSTSTPRVCVLSSWRISRMMMQVRRDGMVGVLPKRAARSITGTTAPRRLITPQIKAGTMGISVTSPYSMISLHRQDADAKHLARQAEG